MCVCEALTIISDKVDSCVVANKLDFYTIAENKSMLAIFWLKGITSIYMFVAINQI